ncbi:MAG: hypothetical protein DRO67_08525, partial [Candidatus Asgardarchaeum californiense]
MTKFSKSLTSIVVFILFSITLVNAEEYTITETFDDVVIGTDGTIVNYYIEADTIVDDTSATPQVITYKKYNIEGTCGAEVIVKERNKDITPFVNDSGEFVTGNSNMFTSGISEWYTVAGLRYKLPQTCNSISMVFDYFNIDDENAHFTAIIQRVDESGVVIWEAVYRMTGYKSYLSDWETLNLGAERFEEYTQGKEFNVIWLVATEISRQSNEGSYFDNLNITLNTVDAIATGTNCDVEVEELTTRVDDLVMETSYKTSEINTLSETNNELIIENNNLNEKVIELSDETKFNECMNINTELTSLVDSLTIENQRLSTNSANNEELIIKNKELLARVNVLIAENVRLASIETTNDCTEEIEELTEEVNTMEEKNNLSTTEKMAILFEKSCPIDGDYKNYGQYVRCIKKLKNSLRREYNVSLKQTVKIAMRYNMDKKNKK